jgi:hypothetical protein
MKNMTSLFGCNVLRAGLRNGAVSLWVLALCSGLVPAGTWSRRSRAAAPPESVSLAHRQTPIKNQNPRDTCWAFAGVAALEAAYRGKYGVVLDLSEQYAFHMPKAMELQARSPENNTSLMGAQGSSDIVKHLSRFAIPEEIRAPYLSGAEMLQLQADLKVGDIIKNPTEIGFDTFEFSERHIPQSAGWYAKYMVTDYGWISNAKNAAELEQTLADNHEVVVDLKLNWRFNADRGVYEYDSTVVGGDHTVVIIGYDRKAQLFTIKNSWGEEDFIRVTYEFIQNCAAGGYFIKDVADLNWRGQRQARFLGFWDFDDYSESNVRLQGRLVIRRFTNLRSADHDARVKLGALYPSGGGAPLNVFGYFINEGEGVVLEVETLPNQFQRFTYPIGFWCFVDKYFDGFISFGTLEFPYLNIQDAVTSVPRKGTIFIKPGSYSAVGVYNKPMTIRAPDGGVKLGSGN